MKEFSTLLSVYKYEKAEYIKTCFDSIYKQTLQPTEIVLVEDGCLSAELYQAIDEVSKQFPHFIRVRLDQNSGLGTALAKGLEACHYDIIARMDTDDICMPDRFEKQMNYLTEHPDIDVVGTWITEFVGDPSNKISIRCLPEEPEEIFEFGKSRNPINHPTVMFRKHAVEAVGGYMPFPLFEDYHLWARMLSQHHRFHNIQESLLLFRRSPEMMLRRGGWSYAKNEVIFQKALYQMGYISWLRMIHNIILRYGIRIMPNTVRSWIYSHFLRKFVS
jgi:glycosyltransferase involved in cell wall biosynthesis